MVTELTDNLVIGVTGPRTGRNARQAIQADMFLDRAVDRGFDLSLRHGDCVGVDEAWHEDAMRRGIKTDVHPPLDETYRAFTYGPRNLVTIHEPKPYLERNVDVVDASHVLVATSKTDREVIRSGTWWTVRYARHIGVPRLIIWPKGSVTYEWDEAEITFGGMTYFFNYSELGSELWHR